MKYIEVKAVQWPEIWKFILVSYSYIIALLDWRQRMMHRRSG